MSQSTTRITRRPHLASRPKTPGHYTAVGETHSSGEYLGKFMSNGRSEYQVVSEPATSSQCLYPLHSDSTEVDILTLTIAAPSASVELPANAAMMLLHIRLSNDVATAPHM